MRHPGDNDVPRRPGIRSGSGFLVESLSPFQARALPPVWPHPEGKVRGVTLEPIHRTATTAAEKDPTVYKVLALLDALRDGRARERALAERELLALVKERLRG
jgi:hypothetical protein